MLSCLSVLCHLLPKPAPISHISFFFLMTHWVLPSHCNYDTDSLLSNYILGVVSRFLHSFHGEQSYCCIVSQWHHIRAIWEACKPTNASRSERLFQVYAQCLDRFIQMMFSPLKHCSKEPFMRGTALFMSKQVAAAEWSLLCVCVCSVQQPQDRSNYVTTMECFLVEKHYFHIKAA